LYDLLSSLPPTAQHVLAVRCGADLSTHEIA